MQVSSVARVFGRRWPLLVVCAILGIAAGAVLAVVVPMRFTATAVVVVYPDRTDVFSTAAPSRSDVSAATEAQVVASSSVAQRAADALGDPSAAQSLLNDVSVDTPTNSQALQVSFAGTSPTAAAAGANAFANAYLGYRNSLAQQRLDFTGKAISARIDDINSQLVAADRAVQSATPGEARSQAVAARQSLQSKVSDLRGQLSQLSLLPGSPGQVVNQAVPPRTSLIDRLPLFLVGGLLVGGLVGAALALWRDRHDDRIIDGEDLEDQVQAPVLAMVPGVSSRQAGGSFAALLADPKGWAAEGYRLLGAKLEAPAVNRGGARFLVLDVPGTGAATAADIAIALAEAGRKVVLVSMVNRLTSVPEWELTMAQSADPGTGAVQAATTSRLSLLPLQHRGERYASLQAENDAGGLLAVLASSYERIIVDGTGMPGSEMLSYAVAVDGVVVSATQRSTTRRAVRGFVAEFHQLDVPVLGAVLVARTRRRAPNGPSRPHRSPVTARRPALKAAVNTNW